jgi:hypothetical protein
VTGRQGRRRKQLLGNPKEKRGYWKLQEEPLDRTLRRTHFGRGCGPVVRHGGMNEFQASVRVGVSLTRLGQSLL